MKLCSLWFQKVTQMPVYSHTSLSYYWFNITIGLHFAKQLSITLFVKYICYNKSQMWMYL